MLYIHSIRTGYPHWGQYSGIHQFVKYLDLQVYSVNMWVASDSDDDFPIKNKAIRAWLRYEVQKRGMKWYKLSDLIAELEAFQRGRRQPLDIIHYLDGEHTVQFLPRLWKFSRSQRPKFIATYHQPPELLDSLLDKRVLQQLDVVTVVSPEQVSYFSQIVEPSRIRLILHGIDTDYFQPKLLPKNRARFRCITVGKYLRDFGALRKVAELLNSFNNIEFHVVSSSTEEVEDLPNVIVHNGIDDAKLLQLYQESDVLFLPLTQSTANNALLEGIACGLPAISTLLPSVKAYLPGSEAILVEDNNPKQLADAVLDLAHNDQICTNMGKAARGRAEELDWRFIVSQYEKLYSKIAEKY